MLTKSSFLSKFGLFLAVLAVLSGPVASPASAQSTPLLIPIGGGYSDVYAGFSQAVLANAQDNRVQILVLPTAYASNPLAISEAERQVNLRDAEERRFQIEEACKRAAPANITCTASLVPVFTRADAEDPANAALFDAPPTAVFILGGDQTVAMQALAGTPLEQALARAYQQGTIVAGTSAGGGMLSATMLAGYRQNYAAGNALDFGAAEVWHTAERRGLSFGIPNVILDQHFYQRGRLGRLLNAIAQPGVPHLGVGVDAYTGVLAPEGRRLEGVFGLYTVTVLDAETYHAADGVRYYGPRHLIGLRNVLVHLLSPGDFSYDLVSRQHSLGAAAPQLVRAFDGLTLPRGAGALILAGDLSDALPQNPILQRFIELAGGQNANLLVMAEGGASPSANERLAQKYADALRQLGAQANTWSADANGVYPSPASDVTGLVFVGRDASKMHPPQWLKEYWLAGKPVLADNAAAALAGSFYSAHAPTPQEGDEAEIAAQKSFLQGRTDIQPGLGLVEAMLEPQVLSNNRWGRIFSLAYNHPDLLTLGLNEATAVEVSAEGSRVLGENGVFVLDLRFATLALGSNGGFVIANGLLDVFAPGETLQPQKADVAARFEVQATPALPTPRPSATPTIAAPTPTPSASQAARPAVGWPLVAGLVLIGFVVGVAALWLLLRRRYPRR